jgi:hypothetical protein
MTDTVTTSAQDATALRSLAWIEAKRFARHPIFLIGLVLAFGLLIQQVVTAPGGGADMTPEGNAIEAAFFLGCFGLLAADRLTRGAFRSREVAVASPIPATTQVKALALACLVPFAAGVVWTVVRMVALVLAADEWSSGALGFTEQTWIVLGGAAVTALGGSLLGVLCGVWLRFPGASAVVLIVVIAWVLAGTADMTAAGGATHGLLDWVRLSAPVSMWTNCGDASCTTSVQMSGSPWLHVLYQFGLCALAVVASLWKVADVAERSRYLRAGLVIAAATVLLLGLSVYAGRPVDAPLF